MKRIEILSGTTVINSINAYPESVALLDTIAAQVADGSWRVAKVQDTVPAPVVLPIITVPAYLRRFDSLCTPPKQAAIACDPHPVCQGLMSLALSRVNEGISLDSVSLPTLLGALVSFGKITADEALAIRTTAPTADEIFKSK